MSQPYGVPHSPSEPPRPSASDEDGKVPYDDLIDQYSTQYKAYAVEPAAFHPAHSRSHFVSPSKQSFSTDMTLKEATARQQWEYPPSPAVKMEEKQSIVKTLLPDSIACRLYVLTVLVETTIDLAIEANLFVLVSRNEDPSDSDNVASRKMPVYLAIFAMAHIFQFAMALDAVWARNTLQFLLLAVFNAVFLVYSIIQISEVKALIPAGTTGFSNIPIDVLTTVIPIVISVAEVAYIGLAWKIYQDFGWKVYKALGADRNIKRLYAHYQIFLCLVKFDLFFWVTFSVQFIWLVLNTHDAEFYLTCAALPLSIVVLVEGHLAARHENKWMMITFMTGCVAAMVYFTYKLVKVLRFKDTTTFILVWKTLTTFSVLAIILLLVTFIFAIIVMHNFGGGLKDQMTKSAATSLQRGKSQYVHRGPMSLHPNRMSID